MPFSFIFADKDIVNHFDNGFSKKLLEIKMGQVGPDVAKSYQYHIVPNSTHKVMLDSPEVLADCIRLSLIDDGK